MIAIPSAFSLSVFICVYLWFLFPFRGFRVSVMNLFPNKKSPVRNKDHKEIHHSTFIIYNALVGIAEKVQDYLAPLLGTNTARIAVRTFAERIGKKPETLGYQDLPALAKSMQGMLRTLCGTEKADKAVKDISAL